MSLEKQIKKARTEIISDGYEMSVGEIINLYKDKEIHINPDFQRLFRWDISRKTKFIESLLLGIPIPPIFVYQNKDSVWELIDGLQRIATILEFVGILIDQNNKKVKPSIIEGTKFLPALAGKKWKSTSNKVKDGIGTPQQIQIKRARIRVEILKQESDPKAKYELFQRLNTGGIGLSEQEVRNCVAVMINKPFFNWLTTCAHDSNFLETIDQTEHALEKQAATELALRFFVYRYQPYKGGFDVHEYLDESMIKMADASDFNMQKEGQIFKRTFELLKNSMGKNSFKRWDGKFFKGKFLMSMFEVVAIGVSKNLKVIETLPDSKSFIKKKCQELWSDAKFKKNSGAGIRGTTRLSNLLPMAENFFKIK